MNTEVAGKGDGVLALLLMSAFLGPGLRRGDSGEHKG
jgi:hypothetical protein